MRFKTPVFICGATALGIAAAVRLGDRAVLAEENGWAAGEFAAAASALKQTIMGDFNLCTPEEVFHLMNGNASGRVQR